MLSTEPRLKMGAQDVSDPSIDQKLQKRHSDSHWDSGVSNKPFAVPRKVLDHLKAAAYSVCRPLYSLSRNSK